MKNILFPQCFLSLKRGTGIAAIALFTALSATSNFCVAQSQFVRLVPTPHMQVTQLLKESKKKEALAFVINYLKSNPNDPQMLFWKAKILNESGLAADKEEALQIYNSLSENYPELAEPHNNLGVIYAGQGDSARAIHYFELALKANPGYALASENLADLYVQQAAKYYQNAIENDPNNRGAKAKLEKLNSPVIASDPLSSSPTTTPKK